MIIRRKLEEILHHSKAQIHSCSFKDQPFLAVRIPRISLKSLKETSDKIKQLKGLYKSHR